MLFVGSSFYNSKPEKHSFIKVYQAYLNNFENFVNQLNTFKYSIDDIYASNQQEYLLNEFSSIRKSYKKVEPFIEYYDSLAVKYYINGAPLPKAEDEANLPNLIKAQGLQVLDEKFFLDFDFNEKEEIEFLLDALLINAEELLQNHKIKNYSPRHFFEAARRQIIRIFTLQLTNFDTPGSANGIEESALSLNVLLDYLSFYESDIKQVNKFQWEKLNFLFTAAITYLNECGDQDYFNHLEFYKNYLQPLYQELYSTHQLLGYSNIKDLTDIEQSVNYDSQFIFDTKFFNAPYFAETNKRDFNDDRTSIGKLLFFDPILSSDNKNACASCHHPDKAFTDGLAKSISSNFKDGLQRNSPTIINSTYADRFFWDLEVGKLSKQIERVIVNQKEFKIDFKQISTKLKESDEYVALFNQAFPNIGINHVTVKTALINYIVSLSSFNSQFDKYVRGEIDTINEDVKDGFNLFMGKAGCATCHFPPTFNGSVPPLYIESESEVLGVPFTTDKIKPILDKDIGRYGNGRRKEHFENYKNSFKTVSVRNVALTAPYMHNGVYESLEEVIEFYNNGGGIGLGISVENQTLPGDSLHLSEIEQQQLITFMESLTDTIGLTSQPKRLPKMNDGTLNDRNIGGDY